MIREYNYIFSQISYFFITLKVNDRHKEEHRMNEAGYSIYTTSKKGWTGIALVVEINARIVLYFVLTSFKMFYQYNV